MLSARLLMTSTLQFNPMPPATLRDINVNASYLHALERDCSGAPRQLVEDE